MRHISTIGRPSGRCTAWFDEAWPLSWAAEVSARGHLFCSCVSQVKTPGIKPRLLSTLLDMVNAERNGETINRGLFRSVTQMLMDLGSAVYQEDFEQHFLKASADFYKVRPSAPSASPHPTHSCFFAGAFAAREALLVSCMLHGARRFRRSLMSLAVGSVHLSSVRPLSSPNTQTAVELGCLFRARCFAGFPVCSTALAA